ncbi:MAG: hypothetical protein R3B67_12550 [Phycisphaerales bacterium]
MAKKKTSKPSDADKKKPEAPSDDRVMNVIAKPTLKRACPNRPQEDQAAVRFIPLVPQVARQSPGVRGSEVQAQSRRGAAQLRRSDCCVLRRARRRPMSTETGSSIVSWADQTPDHRGHEGIIQGRSDKPYTTTLDLSHASMSRRSG